MVRIKKFLVRLLCCFVPVAKWRRNLRKYFLSRYDVPNLSNRQLFKYINYVCANMMSLIKEMRDCMSQKDANFFFLLDRGLPLDENKIRLRDAVNAKMDSNEYKMVHNPCLCGASDDEIIAVRDRYGIKVNTVICKHCGLVRTSPYYDEESLGKFYNTEYRPLYTFWNNDFELFFAQQTRTGERILDNLRKHIGFVPKGKIVYEIGTGMGGILHPFMIQGAKIKGVDLGQEYIDIGKTKGLDLEVGSTDTLKQYPKADLLILSHIVEHIVDPITFLTQCRDIVDDKGVIYVAVPTIEMVGTAYRNNIFGYLQNAHVYDFSAQTLCYVLECAGWSPLHIIVEQGTIIAKKVNKFRKRTDVDSANYLWALNALKKYDEIFYNRVVKG